MVTYYRSSGVYNYVDILLGSEWDVWERGDYYKIRMITENKIKGVMTPVQLCLDGEVFLRYEITDCLKLTQVFENVKPQGVFLQSAMTLLSETGDNLDRYLLPREDLVLSPEYIFYDMKKRTINFIYVPGYDENTVVQVKAFLEYIMKIFDHRDVEGIDFLYSTYEYFAGGGIKQIASGVYGEEYPKEPKTSLYDSGRIDVKEKIFPEAEISDEENRYCDEKAFCDNSKGGFPFNKKGMTIILCAVVLVLSMAFICILKIR